jgi:hypothetical protein
VVLGSRGSRIRCLVVWSAASAAACGPALVAHSRLSAVVVAPSTLDRLPLDVALVDLAALALLACALWLWAVTTVVVVEVLRHRKVVGERAVRGVPAGVRRVVMTACGVALVGGLAQPSYAGGPHVHRGPGQGATLSGLPLPDRAAVPPLPDQRTVLVRPGDTLWSLAERDLPAGSPAALVSARWHAIYAANRSLIGPDPDLIAPGQRLRLPGKDST